MSPFTYLISVTHIKSKALRVAGTAGAATV
jgi:hypothetical protein